MIFNFKRILRWIVVSLTYALVINMMVNIMTWGFNSMKVAYAPESTDPFVRGYWFLIWVVTNTYAVSRIWSLTKWYYREVILEDYGLLKSIVTPFKVILMYYPLRHIYLLSKGYKSKEIENI
jgi:magnesium-transporting ATPase (P-type)